MMIRGYFFAVVLTGLLLSLIACGGAVGGGGGPVDKGGGTTPLNVNIGDAPTDRIAAFALTIDSVVLSGPGVTTTVLGTPIQVEFAHISGTEIGRAHI